MKAHRGREVRRPVVSERGMALIMVVVILTSLLVIGTLFLQTAHLELSSASYYKSTNEAVIMAQSGFARAAAELLYDIWGTNETRPFVADRWHYIETRQVGLKADGVTPLMGPVYEPVPLGTPFVSKGFYKPDGGSAVAAYEKNGVPITQKRSLMMERERNLHSTYPERVFGVSGGQWTQEIRPVLTGLSSWHLKDGISWVDALEAQNLGDDDNWEKGVARWHDAFLPLARDVNDIWEYGMHVNQVFPAGSGGPEGMDRNFGPDDNMNYSEAQQNWPYSLQYNTGDPVNSSYTKPPWNYVNTQTLCSDSFFRIFRYELVDPSFQALNADGTTKAGALHLVAGGSPKTWPAPFGSSGPAVNINQVNNNYYMEQYNDHGTVDPFYNIATGVLNHHYNEAKWIYVYDEDGDPLGRYAVTIHPDGGQQNINSMGNLKRFGKHWSGLDFHTSQYLNGLMTYDWGFSVWGTTLNARYGNPLGTWGNDKNYGANTIKTGLMNDVVNPATNNFISLGDESISGQSDWSVRTQSSDSKIFAWAMLHHLNYYFFRYGALSSRAEVALYFRKYGFLYQEDLNNDGSNKNATLDQNGDGKVTGSDLALTNLLVGTDNVDKEDARITDDDAWKLACMFGPHSYAYMFDRFWDNDRIIVDWTATPGNAAYQAGGDERWTQDKEHYLDPRGIASYDPILDNAVGDAVQYGLNYYNCKLSNPSFGLVKFSRLLSSLRWIAGERAGQWAPTSPRYTDRSKWLQAGKAQAILIASMLMKGSSWRTRANSIDRMNEWMTYVIFGVRVDFFRGKNITGTGTELKDPLIEVYPNPSRKLLLADVAGGVNPIGGEMFNAGFSDIRTVAPGLLQVTEVGRAPILGDVRGAYFWHNSHFADSSMNRYWYHHHIDNNWHVNTRQDWEDHYGGGGTLDMITDGLAAHQSDVDKMGFYECMVVAHDRLVEGGSKTFLMARKPLIMNFIELLFPTIPDRANGQLCRSLAIDSQNMFTNVSTSLPADGLKRFTTTNSGPSGAYLWVRALFYNQNSCGLTADTWYVVDMDLFNPWVCDNFGGNQGNWPFFDTGNDSADFTQKTGAFNAWKLGDDTAAVNFNPWEIPGTATQLSQADQLTLKRRIFGWRGDMVFVRAKPIVSDPDQSPPKRKPYYRADNPVRVMCQASEHDYDYFGMLWAYTFTPDQGNANGCMISRGAVPGYYEIANVYYGSQPSWYSTDWWNHSEGFLIVSNGDYFNYRDGWWDPEMVSTSNVLNGKNAFSMAYTMAYYSACTSNGGYGTARVGDYWRYIDFWSQLSDNPEQYITVWFHPYLFPMLIVYGAADYNNNNWTSEKPYDLVYDFAMLPNYLRGAAGKTYTDNAKAGPTWWDYGSGTGANQDWRGFFSSGDFWDNSPSYKTIGYDITDVPGLAGWDDNNFDAGEDDASEVMIGDYVEGTAAGNGLSAMMPYDRLDSERYIRQLQGDLPGRPGVFFSCSAVDWRNNDDPGMWVYGWTGEGHSAAWAIRDRTTLPVAYDVHQGGPGAAGNLYLSENVYVSGHNISKRLVSNIFPTPHQRNCVWYDDAIFYSTSNRDDPSNEWPWYDHTTEYKNFYDMDGNNRWCGWLANLLEGQDMKMVYTSNWYYVNNWQGAMYLKRKTNITSIPVAYLELSDIDPLMRNARDMAIQTGFNDLWSLGINAINGADSTNFWGDSYEFTRKTDLGYDFHTYRDYEDNNNDGVVDIATSKPFSTDKNGVNLLSWWQRGSGSDYLGNEKDDLNYSDVAYNVDAANTGYYNSDRKCSKKIFLNLAFHPLIISHYTGLWNGVQQRANAILGHKPDMGYMDEGMLMWYWIPTWDSGHPFYMSVNRENTYWNKSIMNNHFQVGHENYMEIRAPNFFEEGVSPVYTILVTGQTINPDDGTAHTQSKLQATIERTWDGKLNILEYQMVPGIYTGQD